MRSAPSHGKTHGEVLAGVAGDMMATTPRASDAAKGGPNQSFGAGGTPLPAQAAQWTTPQAHDVRMRGSGQVPTSKAGNACLARDAAQWPTPARRDYKGENGADHLTNGTGRLHLSQLPNAVAFLFSRPAPETGTHGRPSFEKMRALHRLLAEAGLFRHPRGISRPWTAPTRSRPKNPFRASWMAAESFRRWSDKRQRYWAPRLSPLFVGSLMGWPSGHALCDCSETEFVRWLRLMRGALSALPTASGAWIWAPQIERAKPTQLSMFGGEL
jgi:hypothetical protein